MKKNTGISGSLHKSTKVTLLSCLSFIILTIIILAFFIFFPITPSEKIIASIGRENIFNGNNSGNDVTAIPGVITTTSGVTTTTAGVNTSPSKPTGTTTTKTYKIVITTGSGFMWNGRIPVGIVGNTNTTPIYDDPVYPTPDPGYTYPVQTSATTSPSGTDATDPVNTDYPVTTADSAWTDVEPVSTDASITPEPVDTTPAYTEPPIIIDPPTTHEVIIPVEPDLPYYSEW